MDCRKRSFVRRWLVVFVALCILLPAHPDRAEAHHETVHDWIIRKAVDYLAIRKPEILMRYPVYSYIPWLIKGSEYADSAGRLCRWASYTFNVGYIGMCDMIHHYGYIDKIEASKAQVGHPIAHPGEFAAPEYAISLFNQASLFWPGGKEPALHKLTKLDGGTTGQETPTTKLGPTYLGGLPFCDTSFPDHPEQCPRWPDWASSYPTDDHPDESVQAAMIYLGWSIHLVEDLTNCGHARNLVNKCHGTEEDELQSYVMEGTSFDHLPVAPGSEYRYNERSVVDDFFSRCDFPQAPSFPYLSVLPCAELFPYSARDYGRLQVEHEDEPLYELADEWLRRELRRGELEWQTDAAIKLVAALLYDYFTGLPEPGFPSRQGQYYYLQTAEPQPLWIRPRDMQVTVWPGVTVPAPGGFVNGASLDADDAGRKSEAADRYAFQLIPDARGNYYIMYRNSGKFVGLPFDYYGKVHLWAPIPLGQESRYRFKLIGLEDGAYYLVHDYSGNHLCVNTGDDRHPLELCRPPQIGQDSNYRFRLLMAAEKAPVSDAVRSVLNLPPGLVIDLAHSYEGLDPQGMRAGELAFLEVDRPLYKHGGDLGMMITTGFYWWTMPSKDSASASGWKVPEGVVFALKHSGTQKKDQSIKVFGYDPTDPQSPDYFQGFKKWYAHDSAAEVGAGLYWYESTGENFDWNTDQIWADRLPRGTVIGLKHSNAQAKKLLHWNGQTYDPATNQDPPDGYERRGCYDNNEPEGQGFCWYEKVVGVTLVFNSEKIPVWPRPGVLGDELEWNSIRLGQPLSAFPLDTVDPRICQAYCFQDPKCQAWTYSSGWCLLEATVSAAIPNKCCVSGIKY